MLDCGNNATPRPRRAVNDGYSFGVNQGLAGESYVIRRRCSKNVRTALKGTDAEPISRRNPRIFAELQLA